MRTRVGYAILLGLAFAVAVKAYRIHFLHLTVCCLRPRSHICMLRIQTKSLSRLHRCAQLDMQLLQPISNVGKDEGAFHQGIRTNSGCVARDREPAFLTYDQLL